MRFASLVYIALVGIKLRRLRWKRRWAELQSEPILGGERTTQQLQRLTVLWCTQPTGVHTGESDSDDDWNELF